MRFMMQLKMFFTLYRRLRIQSLRAFLLVLIQIIMQDEQEIN